MKPKLICLIIRDGWGRGKPGGGNAIFNANTPVTDYYESHFPTAVIGASGLDVGLPEGYQGNSEVGHLNIGAGRVVYQSLSRIDKQISSGDFFRNEILLEALQVAKERGSRVHLLGLVQEEGVHAVTRHCRALLQMCRENGVTEVLVHAFSDGRDTPPKSALEHLEHLQEGIDTVGCGRIASVTGRYYAMDRDNRWERTELAYRAIMAGQGQRVDSWQEAIENAYAAGETDEFIKPRIIDYSGTGKDDVMIFFNFRFDRTRQLTRAITEPDFTAFKRIPHNILFVAMTHYYDNGHFREVFSEIELKQILGQVLAEAGIRQLRLAESEKYAHVTFFFNGLRNQPFDLEERILVESPRVATYDHEPEMSADAVKEKLVEAVRANRYRVIICNFANGDMVGHTGRLDKIVTAVETVDRCTGEIVETVLAAGGVCILTGDHGNAEQTRLADGSPMTAHTTNPVPLTLIGAGDIQLRRGGRLCDIAPTILELLGIRQPAEMTGRSLLVK
jgi:2,3-bisphosphoglycerate-independent phosphoglycerate mutase